MSWVRTLKSWGLGPWFAPKNIPRVPSPSDIRQWNVEIDPKTTKLPVPLPNDGVLKVSLHRVLIETGIAMTQATSTADPRSWFALYRYGRDFDGTAGKLRFTSSVQTKDPNLTKAASEEISTGVTCYLLREHFQTPHIADVFHCIQQGELDYVDPNSAKRPDYFCEDLSGDAILAESKGSTGPRGTIMPRIDPEGWEQVQNVRPVHRPLRGTCSRVVIGTHLCIDTVHTQSETTTIIKDPEGEVSLELDPESDMVIRIAYAKALRFLQDDIGAELLLSRSDMSYFREFRGINDNSVLRVFGVPFLPLTVTPFGDLMGLYAPIAEVLYSAGFSSIRSDVSSRLSVLDREYRSRERIPPEVGYILPNGVMTIHNPEKNL